MAGPAKGLGTRLSGPPTPSGLALSGEAQDPIWSTREGGSSLRDGPE